MGRNKTKSKFYNFDAWDKTPGKTVHRPVNQRRMVVLNKLFMKNITEVLATGTTAHSIEGLGIEISKVAITSDFQNVNVLYVCKIKPRPPDLEERLVDAGFSLRHELSQLQLMGVVPRINFVEDKTLKNLERVEELLMVADKGTENEEDECTADSFSPEDEENLLLPQRVYGLNHTKIFEKIMAAKRATSCQKPKTDATAVHEAILYTPSAAEDTSKKENPKHMISRYLRESKVESKSS
ncbi:hypothetical protein GE061_016411 [Apolygus lucorum]|uniref:Ribosome-binding factor A, mitochondrial n=1 Tax=Apolygus lucorum TaxID=248454 RepID=A0A8S9XG63_APOLU|nr:hypothetical protein GE061_016411 [Apolygus lucorum]